MVTKRGSRTFGRIIALATLTLTCVPASFGLLAALTESAGCFQRAARTMSVWSTTIQRLPTTFDPSELFSALGRERYAGMLKDPESEMGVLSALVAAAIT